MHTDHLFYLLLYGPNLSLRVWMDQNLDDEEIYYINNGISIEYEKRKEENEFTSTGKHNSFTDTSYSENTTESFYSTGLDDSGIIESLGE